MNGEIKYKAVDPETNEIFDGDRIEEDDDILVSLSYGELVAFYVTPGGDYTPLKLIEWTGLKDKNGKEIYEGDILTADHYPFQDEGKYNYHGIIEWIEEFASFYMTKRLANSNKRGISDGISEQIENITSFEVIGNIYSNSELLEVSE